MNYVLNFQTAVVEIPLNELHGAVDFEGRNLGCVVGWKLKSDDCPVQQELLRKKILFLLHAADSNNTCGIRNKNISCNKCLLK